MEPVNIQVCIDLDSVSDKFGDKMKSRLESVDKYSFNIPFFRPKVWTKMGKELFESEKQISTKTRNVVMETLMEWAEYQFPAVMRKATASKLAQHVITYVEFCCPQFPLGSMEFEHVAKATCIGLLFDFLLDNEDMFEDGDKVEDEIKEGMQVLISLSQEMMRSSDCLDEEAQTRLFKLEEIHSNRFTSMFLGVLFDLVEETRDTFNVGEKVEVWKTYLKKLFANATVGMMQKDADTIGKCGLSTFRYFRKMEGTINQLREIVLLLKEAELSAKISEDPMFTRFYSLFDEIASACNDLLGLHRDVKNGEESGVILWRVKRGEDLKTVLDEEVAILRENMQDYSIFRDILIQKFGESEPNLQTYLEITDSALFGLFGVFHESDVYGMKGHIKIDN